MKIILKSLVLTMLVLGNFLNFSCQNDDSGNVEADAEVFDSYKYYYMFYPEPVYNSGTGIISIEYDDLQRPIKRIGGLITISQQTGYNYAYSEDFYDELSYDNNVLTIISKLNSDLGYTIAENRRVFVLNGNKIDTKLEFVNENHTDTLNYYYENGKLKKIVANCPVIGGEIYHRNFYYNQQENLDSIVTRDFVWDENDQPFIDYNSLKRTVELFSDYDNSNNQTKDLMIFDELFYRSLSENNFSSYKKTTYTETGEIEDQEQRNWTLYYNGNDVDFNY